jgi:hypothetical protein
MLVGALYVRSINSWSGSKLWFAIFGEKQYGHEVEQSLSLGFPFVIGVVLFTLGLVILAVEYFKKE